MFNNKRNKRIEELERRVGLLEDGVVLFISDGEPYLYGQHYKRVAVSSAIYKIMDYLGLHFEVTHKAESIYIVKEEPAPKEG